MRIEKMCEKEEALLLAKEKLGEAMEMLEEVLPDAAEELCWISENLSGEILAVRSLQNAAADGEEIPCGLFS